MTRKGLFAFAVLALMFGTFTAAVSAQTSAVKEKPPMYSYISNWTIPRAQWGEMAKQNTADRDMLEKDLADGTIVGYGNDVILVHQADGATHDEWWSAMSLGGVIDVLEQFYKSGTAVSPVLESATKHWDSIFVSRYYNWTPGSWKGGYTYVASYKLKPDAPDDAVDTLSKNLVAPLLEKLLADGTLHEYEIDTQAVHSEAPGTFFIIYVAVNPAGLDRVNAAIQASLKAQPLDGPAFSSMVDYPAHRDELVRTDGTYK